MKNINISVIITIFLSLLVGFGLGFFVNGKIEKTSVEIERRTGYRFVSPITDCQNKQQMRLSETGDFKKKIVDMANILGKSDTINHISVYYRNLSNGPWFGIGEDEKFAPASLLKVPLAIAYYKMAEDETDILKIEILCDEECQLDSLDKESKPGQIPHQLPTEYLPVERLVFGQSYTIGELIRRSLMYSDNQSFNLLAKNISENQIKKIHNDLGIPYPEEETEEFVTVKNYASVFRILFNSSYLSEKHSEEILSILNQSTFKNGLVSGVPGGVSVAHKFGIRTGQNGEFQFHDCGIIYQTDNPYILCVMTKAIGNLKEAEQVISKISELIYQENQVIIRRD